MKYDRQNKEVQVNDFELIFEKEPKVLGNENSAWNKPQHFEIKNLSSWAHFRKASKKAWQTICLQVRVSEQTESFKIKLKKTRKCVCDAKVGLQSTESLLMYRENERAEAKLWKNKPDTGTRQIPMELGCESKLDQRNYKWTNWLSFESFSPLTRSALKSGNSIATKILW